jgi:hypothetical protein
MNRCCGLDVHKDSLFASLESKTGMKSMICTYWIEMQFYLYRIRMRREIEATPNNCRGSIMPQKIQKTLNKGSNIWINKISAWQSRSFDVIPLYFLSAALKPFSPPHNQIILTDFFHFPKSQPK